MYLIQNIGEKRVYAYDRTSAENDCKKNKNKTINNDVWPEKAKFGIQAHGRIIQIHRPTRLSVQVRATIVT